MQPTKSNLLWGPLLFLIFLRPFICQMCYPRLDIYYCLIFVFCALAYLILLPKASWRSPLNYPLILLFLALSISTLFSINLRLSLQEIYKFIPYLAAFYLMFNISAERKRKVLIALIGAGCLLSLYAIYQFLWGFEQILDYLRQTTPYPYAEEFLARKRVLATFFSPDMFAGYLIVILPLAAGLFLDSLAKKNYRLAISSGLGLFFMLVALLLTKSIGAALSLSLAFLMFSILLFLLHPALRPKIILAAAISCIIIISILAGLLIIRADSFLDTGSPQNSIVQRLYFWKAALKIIKAFPLTGVGPGNFALIYPYYKIPQAIETWFAHNSYLQIWAEMGILGILGWLWLILKSFAVVLRSLKTKQSNRYLTVGFIAASFAFLVHNMIDFSFFIPEVAFQWWIILGYEAQKT